MLGTWHSSPRGNLGEGCSKLAGVYAISPARPRAAPASQVTDPGHRADKQAVAGTRERVLRRPEARAEAVPLVLRTREARRKAGGEARGTTLNGM